MNRSVLLAGVLCILVFYALLKADFVVILMSVVAGYVIHTCLLYTSPSPRDRQKSRMPSSA